MSGDAQLQVQKAVYDALVAAVTPTAVYDHLPQDTAFPYVVIGEGSAEEFDTTTEVGQDHTVMVHVFTRDPSRGKKAARVIVKQVYDALHNVSLTLAAGAALVFCYFQFSEVMLDPDGLTYHGVSRFRAVTTEA